MSARNFTDLPETAAPGSYLKVTRIRDGSWGVVTYDRTSPGMVKMTGRWFGDSEGEAHLIRLQLEARGYEWRRA